MNPAIRLNVIRANPTSIHGRKAGRSFSITRIANKPSVKKDTKQDSQRSGDDRDQELGAAIIVVHPAPNLDCGKDHSPTRGGRRRLYLIRPIRTNSGAVGECLLGPDSAIFEIPSETARLTIVLLSESNHDQFALR